jgi:hypothetical protein
LNQGFQLVAVSAVVMGLAHTITKERIFLWLRDRLGGQETWCGYLASCPYCASHWLAFLLVPLTGTYPIKIAYDWGFLSVVLSWFFSSILVTVIAAFLRVVFYFVDETQGLVRRRKKTVEQELEHDESQPPVAH